MFPEPLEGSLTRYISTRGEAPVLGFCDVMLTGLARDGGLYVPKEYPRADLAAAREDGLRFKMAQIHAEQDKGTVKRLRAAGRVRGLAHQPDLTDEVIDRSSRIVGMMGPEPFIEALDNGAQVVLAYLGSLATP